MPTQALVFSRRTTRSWGGQVPGGFEVAVQDLRDAAKGPLPALEDNLRWTAFLLAFPDVPTESGLADENGAYSATWNGFYAYCQSIIARQIGGADKIAATADALKSIATLYAKADGQE